MTLRLGADTANLTFGPNDENAFYRVAATTLAFKGTLQMNDRGHFKNKLSHSGGFDVVLPATPWDGELFTLVDNVNFPSFDWRMRFNARSFASQNLYWEFVGGLPLVSAYESSTTLTGSANTWYTFGGPSGGTPGPQITVPATGLYQIEVSQLFTLYYSSPPLTLSWTIRTNQAPASPFVVQTLRKVYSTSGDWDTLRDSYTFTQFLTAGDTLNLQYLWSVVTTPTQTSVSNRRIEIRPFRLQAA